MPTKPQAVLIERWLPYKEVKRRVIFQASPPDPVVIKPRNTIVQWEAPKVEIRKDFKYLGVVKANPADYVQRYGSVLKLTRDLPEFVLDIKHPEGLVLAADYKSSAIHELEGDLHALKLINLEREGLGDYAHYFSDSKRNQSPVASMKFVSSELLDGGKSTSSISAIASMNDTLNATNHALNELITQIFHTIDKDESGRIELEEAEKTLLRLNSRLGRGYGEDDVKSFFTTLDLNNDGKLSLEEFKRAFLSLTT